MKVFSCEEAADPLSFQILVAHTWGNNILCLSLRHRTVGSLEGQQDCSEKGGITQVCCC
jgi:hypothetical protein